MSKLRVEGRQGWSWSHFIISLKAVLAPLYSMTGTPEEIADWLQLETFEPLTDSDSERLRWILKEARIDPEPLPLERDGAIVGYEMALFEPRDGSRFVIVRLKQDEEDEEIEFMTASINYKSWIEFQEALENSSDSSSAVAQCDKRMWTSKVRDSDSEDPVVNEEEYEAASQAPSVSQDLDTLRNSEPLSSRLSLPDVSQLLSLVWDSLPQSTIVANRGRVAKLGAELTTDDCNEIYGQLRRLRFVGGAHQVWVKSKCIGVAYFVFKNGSLLTFMWYKRAGEKDWIREVRRKNYQSIQYEYAVQELKTLKVEEPIPQTFGGSDESLILSHILLNEDDYGEVHPWLLPPRLKTKPKRTPP